MMSFSKQQDEDKELNSLLLQVACDEIAWLLSEENTDLKSKLSICKWILENTKPAYMAWKGKE